jgi:GNAT superfamily N-acetyltransferase
MNGLPAIACLTLALLFAAIGVVQLSGPRFLRNAYASWDYSQAVRIVTGVLDIVAASMLIDPDLRGWGIGLAAVLTFGSVVTLLNHRHYAAAGAAILMMVALVPAALAVPRSDEVRFAAPATRVLANTR